MIDLVAVLDEQNRFACLMVFALIAFSRFVARMLDPVSMRNRADASFVGRLSPT